MRIRLFSLAKGFVVSLMLLLGLGAALRAAAQINPNPPAKSDEITTNDSVLPLVYTVENSGATSGSIEGFSTSNGTPAWPSFANLPIIRPLPDPFIHISTGVRDTSFAGWEAHRQDILNGFETYMTGPKPDCSDCTITASYTTSSANHYALTVKITRTNLATGVQTTTLTSAIVTPSGTAPSNGWPFVMSVDGSGYSSAFPSASVATVPYTSSQVTTSDSPTSTDGFYKLYDQYKSGQSYPSLCDNNTAASPICPGNPTIPGYATYNGNSGQEAAWAWGVSRLLDGLQLVTSSNCSLTNCPSGPLKLDVTHSAVTGCSYAGKIALWAGALDERIALTASEESGGGGVANWRSSYDMDSEYELGTHDGSVEDIDTTDHRWWCVQCMHSKFSSVVGYKMPVDLHEAAALTAPRALVESANTEVYFLANESDYVSARAIQKVYNTLGIGDRFGFIVDSDHGHCAAPAAETAAVAQFVNRYILGQSVSTDVESYPNGATAIPNAAYVPTSSSMNPPPPTYPMYFPSMDYQRWTDWWGTGTPQFANDWNTGGTTNLWFNNPMTVNTNDVVEAGYAIQMSAATHPAATVQVKNAAVNMDVTCSDGSSYTLDIPMSTKYGTGQTFTIPANNTSWYPSSSPTDPSTFQGSISGTGGVVGSGGVVTTWNENVVGSIVNPGCANGGPGTVGRAYFAALGVQANDNGVPAGPGFVTTDTTQSPIVVMFHAADMTNGQGGAWSPPVTVNQLPLNYGVS